MNGSVDTVQVNVDDVKQNLLLYLQRAQAGEAFVVVTAGEPLAEIRPVTLPTKLMRPAGLCAGEFRVPDDFNDPLPEHVVQEFEGR